MAAFAGAYALMGAQRASKILGIFARLDKRDGKPIYLAHIPRVKNYLRKNLGHPALADLKAWFDLNLPQIFVQDPRSNGRSLPHERRAGKSASSSPPGLARACGRSR